MYKIMVIIVQTCNWIKAWSLSMFVKLEHLNLMIQETNWHKYKKGFKQLTFYDFKTYTFKIHWFISTSSTLLNLKNVNSSDIETKCLLRYNLPSNKLYQKYHRLISGWYF